MKFIVEKPLLKIQRIWIIIAWINRFLITEKKTKAILMSRKEEISAEIIEHAFLQMEL